MFCGSLVKQPTEACMSHESPLSSMAALSKASEVPLIVCVLNAEPLEHIHF